jgi:hypothetical protein
MPPIPVDKPPFFDLLDRSKAAETDEIVIQTAISYARGLRRVFDMIH